MNNRDFGVLLIPILAALAIVLPLTTGTKPPVSISTPLSEQKAQAAPKQEEAPPLRGAKKLLGEFLGKNTLESKDLADYELNFIIATVPDPIDSNLGYILDSHLAAIQRATEGADYLLDRFHLPWSERSDQEKDRNIEVADHILERLRQPRLSRKESQSPRDDQEPAVVLFRGEDRVRGEDRESGRRLLILLLVGETPTTGIQKAALNNALQQVQGMCAWGKRSQGKCEEFRLLAPTFSGSAESLKIALNSWRNGKTKPKFKIVSGSATAIEFGEFPFVNESFSATVWKDSEAIGRFLNYLVKDLGARRHEIAILTDTSAYGQAAGQATRIERSSDTLLQLTYPLHISQLRRAAEKAKGPGKEAMET